MSAENEYRLHQRHYFDRETNRYPQERIISPSNHVQRELNEIISKIPPLGEEDEIADFGSGSGRLTIPMLQRGFRVYAIDVSPESLESLKGLASKLNLANIQIATEFPTDRKFKYVVGTDILHHVSLNNTLPQVYDSLQEGGKVVFSEPGALNPSWYVYLSVASSWSVERGLMHSTYTGLIKSFQKHGFNSVAITGLGFFPTPLFNFSNRLSQLNDRIGNVFPLKHLAYRFIIEATK